MYPRLSWMRSNESIFIFNIFLCFNYFIALNWNCLFISTPYRTRIHILASVVPRSIQIELTGHGQDRSFYGLFFDLSPASGVLCLHPSAFPSLYMHLQRVPPLSCFRSYYPLLLQRPVRFVNVQSDPYLGYILERAKRFELSRGLITTPNWKFGAIDH